MEKEFGLTYLETGVRTGMQNSGRKQDRRNLDRGRNWDGQCLRLEVKWKYYTEYCQFGLRASPYYKGSFTGDHLIHSLNTTGCWSLHIIQGNNIYNLLVTMHYMITIGGSQYFSYWKEKFLSKKLILQWLCWLQK